jgi:hypothetical protein
MPIGPAQNFPTIESIMELARSIVRDTFPGINGAQGRIFTDDAPFTLPFLNSAIRWMNRQLRNEGVTYPIVDGFTIFGLTPQASQDPGVTVNLSFNGYFDGMVMNGNIVLPADLFQPLVVKQRVSGSNLPFVEMIPAQRSLASTYPLPWLGNWQWRQYAIYMNGSTQTQDIQLRYIQGQLPFNTLPADFDTTVINVQDCEEAVANRMAFLFGNARSADPQALAGVKADAEEAIGEMALAYVRQAQNTSYSRPSYQGGGSNSGENTTVGSANVEF